MILHRMRCSVLLCEIIANRIKSGKFDVNKTIEDINTIKYAMNFPTAFSSYAEETTGIQTGIVVN